MPYYVDPDFGSGLIFVAPDTEGMVTPVRCRRCGGVYDVGKVTVLQRYADCSVWRAPCCGREVDDRADIEYLPRRNGGLTHATPRR